LKNERHEHLTTTINAFLKPAAFGKNGLTYIFTFDGEILTLNNYEACKAVKLLTFLKWEVEELLTPHHTLPCISLLRFNLMRKMSFKTASLIAVFPHPITVLPVVNRALSNRRASVWEYYYRKQHCHNQNTAGCKSEKYTRANLSQHQLSNRSKTVLCNISLWWRPKVWECQESLMWKSKLRCILELASWSGNKVNASTPVMRRFNPLRVLRRRSTIMTLKTRTRSASARMTSSRSWRKVRRICIFAFTNNRC